MSELKECFDANREWATRMLVQDGEYFNRLRHQQNPELLWIGCSDSRLPPDRIIQKQPGEVFVHRNVGNVVVHSDMNVLSVLQYGIEVLGVHHVIVCGHYGCGGVRAALKSKPLGLIDNWLRHIRDVHVTHRAVIDAIETEEERVDRLCELNVMAQMANVCRTTLVLDAWKKGHSLTVHGWIYSVADGLLRDLNLSATRPDQIPDTYRLP
ncbi:MAG: carbonate dehydratase [Deltaproteobacteria bacterium]|nr:carbonate dehydratase [Deltaproteobacteria bacterium]